VLDEGVKILQTLIDEFRDGRISRVMRFTITLMLAHLGPAAVRDLLSDYHNSSFPDTFASGEADSFAVYLRGRVEVLPAVPFLADVLNFEHALIRACLYGASSRVEWSVDPAELFGHFTYFLLIVSMLMRRMVWLRGIAIASGVTKIIYRAFLVVDPVSVLWETIFVLVNAAQLAIIWYYERHHRFEEEERHFADGIPADIERRSIKRLLQLADLDRVAVGQTLTVEGEPVRRLMYLADGVVKIERAGKLVAICGPGDYVGELSFLSHNNATATATAVAPVRILSFDQEKLRISLAGDKELQRVLDTALNRNLAGKLTRVAEEVVEGVRVP